MFKSAKIYKLINGDHYDDEYGEGFDHVETYGDSDGSYITDCWVVNSDGDVHPGYENSPVPIRFDRVEPKPVGNAKNRDRERSSAMWS